MVHWCSLLPLVSSINIFRINYGNFIFVIFLFRFSGTSPFLGDNDCQTYFNVTKGHWQFTDKFSNVSEEAIHFINSLIVYTKEYRKQHALLNFTFLSNTFFLLENVLRLPKACNTIGFEGIPTIKKIC